MNHLEHLLARYPMLKPLEQAIREACLLLIRTFAGGGKLLVCGNGGSASDADHIVGELMKGFLLQRPLSEADRAVLGPLGDKLQGALPAISLGAHTALGSAFANDIDPELVYAQQVWGYGQADDCLLGLSTSGNSRNVLHALTGRGGFTQLF